MNLKDINTEILKEILEALERLEYGSVEIVVQAGEITQISTRNIKKTKISKNNLKNSSVLV